MPDSNKVLNHKTSSVSYELWQSCRLGWGYLIQITFYPCLSPQNSTTVNHWSTHADFSVHSTFSFTLRTTSSMRKLIWPHPSTSLRTTWRRADLAPSWQAASIPREMMVKWEAWTIAFYLPSERLLLLQGGHIASSHPRLWNIVYPKNCSNFLPNLNFLEWESYTIASVANKWFYFSHMQSIIQMENAEKCFLKGSYNNWFLD